MEKYHYKIILKFLLLCLLVGCNKPNNVSKTCIPDIIIETNKDTLRVGEEYIAKIYLSDNSFFHIKDHTGKTKEVFPVFKVNSEFIESDKDYYEHKEIVSLENAHRTSGGTLFRQWSCSIVFPHPDQIESAVEIYGGTSYVIKE